MAMPDPENIFEHHDHRQCRHEAMRQVSDSCARQHLRLTPLRARVLEILLESHRAMGAYEILERLREEGQAGQPPTVYRALEFLVTHGFVHRLERLNAFMACCHVNRGTDKRHEPLFLICNSCRKVAEAPLGVLGRKIDRQAGAMGFVAQSRVVEVLGLCPACRGELENG